MDTKTHLELHHCWWLRASQHTGAQQPWLLPLPVQFEYVQSQILRHGRRHGQGRHSCVVVLLKWPRQQQPFRQVNISQLCTAMCVSATTCLILVAIPVPFGTQSIIQPVLHPARASYNQCCTQSDNFELKNQSVMCGLSITACTRILWVAWLFGGWGISLCSSGQ